MSDFKKVLVVWAIVMIFFFAFILFYQSTYGLKLITGLQQRHSMSFLVKYCREQKWDRVIRLSLIQTGDAAEIDPRPHLFLSCAYAGKGQLADALRSMDDFTVAVKKRPLRQLNDERLIEDVISILLNIGDDYLKQGEWSGAMTIFGLGSRVEPNYYKILSTLHDRYRQREGDANANEEWNEDIYLPLDHSEVLQLPSISQWAKNNNPTVVRHEIQTEHAIRGAVAEILELEYDRPGTDYWALQTMVPLDGSLGVRFFLRSDRWGAVTPVLGMKVPEDKHLRVVRLEPVSLTSTWQEILISDAKAFSERQFSLPDTPPSQTYSLYKVGFDTGGRNLQVYADGFEVFLSDQ